MTELGVSEVLAAMSHALDLVEGQPEGHAERTCAIALRVAADLGLDDADRAALGAAALLKDAGCSSTAAKVAELYGADDGPTKAARRTVDLQRRGEAVRHLLQAAAPGASRITRLRHLRALVGFGHAGSRGLVALRCERGAAVAAHLGLGPATIVAMADLDEHWDGHGYPQGLRGERISLGGRILCLAQTAEVFWQRGGAAAACAIVRRRRGAWFDPAVADALLALEGDRAFWRSVARPDPAALRDPGRGLLPDPFMLDRTAEAFATVVDAKSSFTAAHSAGVAELASALGEALGVPAHERRDLRRAGLLHDIGKLGVSNRVLDKAGPLTGAEWATVRRHPRWSWEVLRHVGGFARVAALSVAHHERLDGRGYHRGLTGEHLDGGVRILAVADMAEALSADRPYRPGLEPDAVLAIARREAGTGLDPDAVDALGDVLPRWARQDAPGVSRPAAP